MCGISGSINTDVRTIAEKQRHRGPDNFSVNQMFAHNRLSIIDLSENGNQPMTYGGYEITFNGEIYNYKELASYLHVNDDLGDFIQAGDTFTFLKYISKFGIKKALNDSVGMWAFGLLDKRENKIHLVVDRLGEKPLYYFQEGEVFAFSSSPAALLHLKDKWKINEQAFGNLEQPCITAFGKE
jgi:asparagine synthetase B (glutamine-hydrolysing)